jgi:hypothetical protein
MKALKDCRFSAFISYSHAADEAHGKWVSQFREELFVKLRARLRGAVGVVPQMHLSGDNGPVAGALGRELERNVADSYAMIIVVDENYVASRWCLKELEYFKSLFGARGFEERLYIVAMSEPAMDTLTHSADWARLAPDDIVWTPFFRENDSSLPVRVYLDNGAQTERFENQLDRVLGRLVESIKKPVPPPPPPSEVRPSSATLLFGVSAPEFAAETARIAAELRCCGVDVHELDPEMLQGELAEFDATSTLVLPFGSGGAYLPPFKFTSGGHLAGQRGAWLGKDRPAKGLVWLDLRHLPCATPAGKGHAELVAEVAPLSLSPEALIGLYRGEPEGEHINIYIESNQNEVDVWDDLGERIKSRWQALLKQYEPAIVPPLRLNARGLPLQKIDNEPLDDADGVVLLWGNKTEDSLRAQIKKVESKLIGDPPPGIVAYLIPHREDPQHTIEAAYWKVLRFQDSKSADIDIVPPEAERLDKFLRKILDRNAKHKQPAATALARLAG